MIIDGTEPAMWGETIARATGGSPFLQFSPRPGNLSQVLAECRRFPDRPALVQDDRQLTFADLVQEAEAFAGTLVSNGIGPGDRVLLLGWNSVDWVVAFWATVRTGAVAVLGNSWWGRPDVVAAIELVDPMIVVVDDHHAPLVAEHSLVLPMARVGLAATREDRAELDPAPAAVDENDPAVVIFTSGSTGRPKGVVLSHRSVIAQLHSVLQLAGRLPRGPRSRQETEVTLVTGPLFHVGALQTVVRAVVVGATLVFLEGRFLPEAVANAIERHHITRWGCVPTMLSRVVGYLADHPHDVSSLRSITLGGSAVSPALVEQARTAFPRASAGFGQLYGMTETGGSLTYSSGRVSVTHPGSAGRALPLVELRIAGADAHGVGEIEARSATQMSGYWGDSNGSHTVDGWFATGDLGRLSEDGLLFVVGRSKDVIIRGGENVSAGHVETQLTTHPDVVQAAVLGVPDSDLGERVGAVVMLRPGADPATLDRLDAYLRARLSSFEIPDVIVQTEVPFPITPTNKVDKAALLRLLLTAMSIG